MKLQILIFYIICTICMITYAVQTYNNPLKYSYVTQVHNHMSSIMYFHITICAIMCYLNPDILKSTTFSIANTLLSIMFSYLFYLTKRSNVTLQHIYNALYLFFASVLLADFFLYFENDNVIYSGVVVFLFFFLDTILYKKDRRKQLIFSYIITSIIICSLVAKYGNNKLLIATMFNCAYSIAVLIWEYMDHEYLENTHLSNHLNDALKYFFDVEGMIVRLIT